VAKQIATALSIYFEVCFKARRKRAAQPISPRCSVFRREYFVRRHARVVVFDQFRPIASVPQPDRVLALRSKLK
jgi:hypothetical protein